MKLEDKESRTREEQIQKNVKLVLWYGWPVTNPDVDVPDPILRRLQDLSPDPRGQSYCCRGMRSHSCHSSSEARCRLGSGWECWGSGLQEPEYVTGDPWLVRWNLNEVGRTSLQGRLLEGQQQVMER